MYIETALFDRAYRTGLRILIMGSKSTVRVDCSHCGELEYFRSLRDISVSDFMIHEGHLTSCFRDSFNLAFGFTDDESHINYRSSSRWSITIKRLKKFSRRREPFWKRLRSVLQKHLFYNTHS